MDKHQADREPEAFEVAQHPFVVHDEANGRDVPAKEVLCKISECVETPDRLLINGVAGSAGMAEFLRARSRIEI
jgi:hypothetical protein